MNLRKLEPCEEVFDDKIYLIAVLANKTSEHKIDYRILDNRKILSVRQKDEVYEIIESPEPVERDWSEIVEELHKAIIDNYSWGHVGVKVKEDMLKILQQSDKPTATKLPEKLPCPFCKGDKSYCSSYEALSNVVAIVCIDCGARGAYKLNDKEAIAAWNRRA